jgi:hypothetical protein
MAFKLLFAVLAAVLVALATLATPAAAAEADSLTATSNGRMLKWGGYSRRYYYYTTGSSGSGGTTCFSCYTNGYASNKKR